MNKYGSPEKSSSPLSGDEVKYKLFPFVRGLERGKGRFVENTSPLE